MKSEDKKEQPLEEAVQQLKDGKGKEHELIEEEDDNDSIDSV